MQRRDGAQIVDLREVVRAFGKDKDIDKMPPKRPAVATSRFGRIGARETIEAQYGVGFKALQCAGSLRPPSLENFAQPERDKEAARARLAPLKAEAAAVGWADFP